MSVAADLERELLTAEGFLGWLLRAFVDEHDLGLLYREVVAVRPDPKTLAHRFYRRVGELLVEYANGEALIDSQ